MTGYSADRMAILHLGREHFWFRHRNFIIEMMLWEFLPGIQCPDILELGCGSGIIANYFIHRGQRVSASDLEPGFQSFLPQQTPTFLFDLRHDPIPAEQKNVYDAVILGDVIEHIPNPVATLNRINGFLKKGGILILTVPALQSLWSNLDDISNHVKRYDKATLASEVRSAGYHLEQTAYFMFIPALILYVQRKIILNKTSKMLNRESLHIPDHVNRIMMGVMTIENRMFPYLKPPFGSSLIAVGRKI